MHFVNRVGLVLLAAGGSRRLGAPKQLLADGMGQTLIRRAAETALSSACRPIVVVTGASAESVATELTGLELTLAVNSDWQSGMASSLKIGASTLLRDGPLEAIVVMLCDQPQVTSTLLNSLIALHLATGQEMVVCEYGGIQGAPALFGPTLFGPLTSLWGDEGMRRVIRDYAGSVTCLPFPGGLLDVDTPQEAAMLRDIFPNMPRVGNWLLRRPEGTAAQIVPAAVVEYGETPRADAFGPAEVHIEALRRREVIPRKVKQAT